MIKDLNGNKEINQSSDIVIIGAGTVGLLISSILSKKGFDVLTLESGSMVQELETHPLNEVVYKKSIYNSSKNGRFRCLGGTSTRWGGALLPLLPKDIINGNWPILPKEILKYTAEVEHLFGLPNDSYEYQGDLSTSNQNFMLRYAKLPSFRNRNVHNLFKEIIDSNKGPNIWINATVTKFIVKDKNLSELVAVSNDGSKINIKGKKFIFAAGAIESTRLMLLLDQQNKNCIKKISPNIGKFFCDHISIPISNIEINDQLKLNKIFGYHFESKKTMKNIRFELNENSEIRKFLPPFFARIIFSDMNGGYENLRNFFRIIQKKKIPSLKNFMNILKTTPWILKAIWWRFIKKRLVFPKNAKLEAHIIMEQLSSQTNKISLSENERDSLGQPLAEIDWSISEADSNNILKAGSYLKNFWDSTILKKIGNFNMKSNDEIISEIKADGIHHPSGSTRMGKNSKEGVVDKNLKLFALNNTRILSTSVFPTGSGGNPTMTLFMLALRCMDQISNEK